MAYQYKDFGPLLLRVSLAALFLATGITKLLDVSGPTGMLEGFGFPAPAFFAWLLLLVEIIFGLIVLAGWKLRYTVWPLVIVLIVALVLASIPGGNIVSILFHVLGIAALVSLALTGPGVWAFKSR